MSNYAEPWIAFPNGWAGPGAPPSHYRYHIYFNCGIRHRVTVASDMDAMDAMRAANCVNALAGIECEALQTEEFKQAIARFRQ